MVSSTMMRLPLLISSVIEHAATWHAEGQVISAGVNGRSRFGYGEIAARAKALAQALLELGLRQGDRVGTLALNSHRHLEAYYAISGAGMVCHTINPRLAPAQLAFVIRHAGDQVLLVDAAFLAIAREAAAAAGTVRTIIVFERLDE